mgnify:CR=1 FL=1
MRIEKPRPRAVQVGRFDTLAWYVMKFSLGCALVGIAIAPAVPAEPTRELPAPEQRVRADGDEHRRRGREDLELEDRNEDELRLPEQQGERDERRRELAEDAETRLVPDRAAVVRLVWPELRLLIGAELTHGRMVAAALRVEPAPKA